MFLGKLPDVCRDGYNRDRHNMRLALHALVSADLLRSLDLRPFEAFSVTETLALAEAKKIKRLMGKLRCLFRGTSAARSPQFAEMKHFIKKRPPRYLKPDA